MKNEILTKLLTTNLLPLAYLGDSVHTLFIREKCLSDGNLKLENYHLQSAKFCKASAQAAALEHILPLLSEEELAIVKRGRNAKPKHHAKNATSSDYSHATAFEALIGYLYLNGDQERLGKILNESINF